MKNKLSTGLFSLLLVSAASAQSGLYYVGSDAQESIPLKWVVGASLIYDDNVAPGSGVEDSSMAVNPYVGVSFVTITPQTTWDVYARIGLIYYFDAPDSIDDTGSNSRIGVNLTHRFSERLRFSSRSFVAYELEPEYSYGVATTRVLGEYFFFHTDNSIGYRWSERLATYTGIRLSGTDYSDVANNDRVTWELYNQFRYQMSPQTVLTAEYRYADTMGDGFASDSTDQYLLLGVEHRFSPNTIGIVRAGAQFRDVDGGDKHTSPYLEAALNSQVNSQFRVGAFARYGIESYDTVIGLVEFEDRRTLRIGVSGDYALSPMFSIFGGIDYIATDYQEGRDVMTNASINDDASEDLINAYIGLSVKFNDFLTGTASYNYTDSSSSDIPGRDYDRSRISIGLSAEF
ncbi:MAG: hypothetical protein EAZ42_11620 [Verrucomicrobia bacterium]|nr:MAG: hypothetical protein EAZ42_11620 [Verrucomicrobiota bacterium]